MILTFDQTNELLKIINVNQLTVMGQELGPDFLTADDRRLLKQSSVDVDALYSAAQDSVYSAFHFGMLSEALGHAKAQKLSYDQLKAYIQHGDYIPLTVRETVTVNSIRAQKFNDLKTLNGKIFKDVNQVLVNGGLKAQREFLKEEIAQGYLDKKTVREVSNTIAEKTGDWSRDFDRIVAYTTTLAEQEGKAAMIERNAGEEDPVVYKLVFEGACKHCVRLYLTNGVGSQPRLFKLSELRANGTNIGRKVDEWLPCIGPIHPFCRCILMYLPKGYTWNEKTQKFEPGVNKEVFKPKRPKIRVWIGGEEAWV